MYLGIGMIAILCGSVLLLAWLLKTPTVQAQTATDAGAPKVFLPLIQTEAKRKQKSGIHLGNRSTDWRDENQQYTFLNQIGRTGAGIWPAAVVVLSDQLYDLQRFDTRCQVSGASVKTVAGKEYELFRYLTEGVRNHNLKVVIRLSPSPGNFSDYDAPGDNHALLTTEAPPNSQDYCGDSNAKTQQYRDILDLAKEMRAIYQVNIQQHGWYTDAFFFEPTNEPNQEWYQRHVEAGVTNLAPNVDNKQAWIEMDNYFAALYDRAVGLQRDLQILAPSMSQDLYGEHYDIGTCIPKTVVGGNRRSGLDFMKKVYGYDIGIDAYTTPKADGFAWHNYWRKDYEIWLPPYRGTSYPPTVDDYCDAHQPVDPDGPNPYKPPTDHVFQYLSGGMQQSIQANALATFITEADLKSPCQLGEEGAATSKDADTVATSNSLLTFIEQETQAYYGTGYGAQYVIAWLVVNQYADEDTVCKTLLADGKKRANPNYEQNWHEAYREDGTERPWFQRWWPAPP